jgi:hypothetical protein
MTSFNFSCETLEFGFLAIENEVVTSFETFFSTFFIFILDVTITSGDPLIVG